MFDAVAADPAADHSTPKLAALAAMSPRHLIRLFHEELGTTPAKYVEAVRFDGAKAALESSYTITEAAERVGYGSSETLRHAFVARLGVSPSAYQQRFRSAQRGAPWPGQERHGPSEPRRYPPAGANPTSATTDGNIVGSTHR